MSEVIEVDVVVVGAGFAGMYMLHKLREQQLNVQVIEAGDDVGGTWYWNRYPGARCDVESMEYSYQFSEELQQQWNWSERYAAQPEILKYASHVADRFDLRDNIQFERRVVSASFDESCHKWLVTTDQGDRYKATFCIMGTGCLSSTNLPDFAGLNDFKGNWYHTGQWPKEGVDFTGKRVAVVGTGSSAIQSIPHIAAQAAHLTVFQRTANFSIPAHNGPLADDFVRQIKSEYAEFRKENRNMHGGFGSRFVRSKESILSVGDDEREQQFEENWALGGFQFLNAFADLSSSTETNQFAADFVRKKIRAMVDDEATATLLCPEQIIGCKRLCVDIDYYQTYNRPNVSLVSVKDNPIQGLTENGLMTTEQEYEFDIIVFATGFDAMTGSLLKMDISGKDGATLADKWHAGPHTLLGLQVNGFPNLFTISGPGSPSVLSNMVVSIQQHVDWISDCIAHMRLNSFTYIEAELAAEQAWVKHTNEIADRTLYPTCNSWYLGANIPGKVRVFMPYVGGLPAYAKKCDEVAKRGYEGFLMQSGGLR
ncbi:MAG: NAD(P)/FAD-dependent oxidoreductase [Pseudomonadales bacterium]|nr:NAD(P)/FAD-dependent oxidoreductase [Pseudomonadales bacterium]